MNDEIDDALRAIIDGKATRPPEGVARYDSSLSLGEKPSFLLAYERSVEPPTLASVQALIDRLDREGRARLRVHLLAVYDENGDRRKRVHDR